MVSIGADGSRGGRAERAVFRLNQGGKALPEDRCPSNPSPSESTGTRSLSRNSPTMIGSLRGNGRVGVSKHVGGFRPTKIGVQWRARPSYAVDRAGLFYSGFTISPA